MLTTVSERPGKWCLPPMPMRWFISLLLVVECLMWLSQRFQWFSLNHKKGFAVLITISVVAAAMLLTIVRLVLALALRGRFQFSVRSLLALVVVVAVPSSWLGTEMEKARSQSKLLRELRKVDGSAMARYDFELELVVNGRAGKRPGFLAEAPRR